MKVLVTGANGYIGRHVVSALLNVGCNVVACDLRLQDVDARAEQMEMNLFESDSHLYDKVGSPDVCWHGETAFNTTLLITWEICPRIIAFLLDW